jgi:hypothetical protein
MIRVNSGPFLSALEGRRSLLMDEIASFTVAAVSLF